MAGSAAGTGDSTAIREVTERFGVQALACENSLMALHMVVAMLTKTVETVPAAVGYLARQQWAGSAYVRI